MLEMKDRNLKGMFESGTDVSVIALKYWPHNWAL